MNDNAQLSKNKMKVEDFEDYEEVLKFSKTEKFMQLHENRYLSEYNKAIEEGKIKGIKQVAQKALKTGISTEQIATITGLSVEEINKLK